MEDVPAVRRLFVIVTARRVSSAVLVSMHENQRSVGEPEAM